ncbi:HNH endonuclease [Rhodococcus sp. PAMC28707]|uniref:HNH endonuclease signature motif containing protein n=1 Tax=unclassified Rhodococcus (in: high G+C Gram-positive bacteria) TaxID=192944 RepID=UPI00109DFF61|nr:MULTISPECIES: HNH endonuclease signature motif containing protein [unclassified Rhodococcus (in: high G+C Gram-positive bacteria)]QCB49798.1 HNH endonuclease [Rhodococcus sp. PAMC28705]QCB58509.1 HNH endonuclease [Rhodococcus sp. PAMC28707]
MPLRARIKKRTYISGFLDRVYTRTTSTPRGEDSALRRYVDPLLREIDRDPSKVAGVFPDGHGGLENPPPGALTYRPSKAVASMIRMAYHTCTCPGCDTPSSRCQLDHIVPFDLDNPRAGGWTVGSNLHPVCTCRHQAKTARMWACAMLSGGAILRTATPVLDG